MFFKADSLVDKTLSCPRIKLSNLQTLIFDGVETGIFLLDFAQQLRRTNADVPDINFTLLDDAGISPTLIPNQNAKDKERERKVGPFQNLNVKSCKGCTHSVELLMGLCST